MRQPFLASGRYDVLPFLPLFATLARVLDTPFDALVRNTAAAQCRYDTRTVFKAMWSTADMGRDRRSPRPVRREYYDFGKFAGSMPEPNLLVIVHAGIPAYVYPWYSLMHVAYTEESVRNLSAGPTSPPRRETPSCPPRKTAIRG